jgi:uncharacterized protein (TIGR00369 family)
MTRPTEESSASSPNGLSPDERRRWDERGLHDYLGIRVVEQRDGYSRLTMRTSERTRGGVGGSVHGGILATLVDVATLVSVASAVGPDQQMNGTAELNISYLRPALGEVVVTEGRVLKLGRTLAVVDVDISDGKGRLFAKGRVQYSLRSKRADRE